MLGAWLAPPYSQPCHLQWEIWENHSLASNYWDTSSFQNLKSCSYFQPPVNLTSLWLWCAQLRVYYWCRKGYCLSKSSPGRVHRYPICPILPPKGRGKGDAYNRTIENFRFNLKIVALLKEGVKAGCGWLCDQGAANVLSHAIWYSPQWYRNARNGWLCAHASDSPGTIGSRRENWARSRSLLMPKKLTSNRHSSAGFQQHVAKPVDPQTLVSAISALCNSPPDSIV